ncbi:MAG: TlpA disulfide reductase family protein [Candidatus Korarchaeota archaeon]|nr:TlpA disulfide reductase family protein [Candidatus Korarchaeota archaeon]
MRHALPIVLLILVMIPLLTALALPREGEEAPYFNVSTYEGDRVSPERLKGKVFVLVFAAEWCPHCREELPALSRAWKDAGLDREGAMCVVMIVSSSQDKAIKFYESVEPPSNWRLVPDANYIAEKYGVSAVPTMIVVDQEGKVAKTFRGAVPPQQITNLVADLIGVTPQQGNYTSPSPSATQTHVSTTPSEENNGQGLKPGHIILIGLGVALVVIFGIWYYRTLKKFETSKKGKKKGKSKK